MFFITLFVFIFIIWVSFSFSSLVNEQIDYSKLNNLIEKLIEKNTSKEKISTILNEFLKKKEALSIFSGLIDKINNKDPILYPPCQQLTTTLVRDLAKNDKKFISSMSQMITDTILNNNEAFTALESITNRVLTKEKIESVVKNAIEREIIKLKNIVNDNNNINESKFKALDAFNKEVDRFIKQSVLLDEKTIIRRNNKFIPHKGSISDRQAYMLSNEF